MYSRHPSSELNELFAQKPYQGAAPDEATFLFVGLDANYHRNIAAHPIFPSVLAYHADGVAFWREQRVHHPFLLPGYTGDGHRYHQNFARIGFRPEHAPLVSFIELLHVPTVGRNLLVPADLSSKHLKRLNALILDSPASNIFISVGVAQLMRASGLFPWLPEKPSEVDGPLRVWFRNRSKSVYSHLHFANYGKFVPRMKGEASAIRALLPMP
jgi:hypothetical protein